MREILFRGKKLETSVFDKTDWVYGSFIDSGNHEQVAIYPWFNGASTMTVRQLVYVGMESVKPETVGQFTGLTDKNGKKIFEGDIVHCVSWMDEANLVVIFEDGEFRMVLCEKYKDYIPGCGFYAIRCFDKEVIGNIHDNPELLGGAE